MNAISNTKFKYNSHMIPSKDFPYEHLIPQEAFEKAEDIIKTPFMTYGRTLPVAINFFMSKIPELVCDKNIKFLKALHKFLKSMINDVKTINFNIQLNESDLSMICPKITEFYNIKASPSVCDIISKFDPRVRYLCENDENLINMFNLNLYSFGGDFKISKDYEIEFDIKVRY